ncbi:DUF6197 family protein [Micromonospora haikouensis]|uniref:DUF6197 family protein n=1 Tax=Micromonospora haikouensis TaxID=686309 RepID=UPI003D73E29E
MKATQIPPHAETVTPADLLRMAALYLRRHGWHQGAYYADPDHLTPPACAAGAIGMASTGHQVDNFLQLDHLDDDHHADTLAALAAFVDYLDAHEPVFYVDEDGFLVDEHGWPFSWNDDPARTAEQVVTALEAAADEWDSLHTTGGENR